MTTLTDAFAALFGPIVDTDLPAPYAAVEGPAPVEYVSASEAARLDNAYEMSAGWLP